MGFNQIAVLIGALFLYASLRNSRKISSLIPIALQKKWQVIEALMLFFLFGYILLVFLQIRQISFPVDYLVSLVFLGGAIFVYIVINISEISIRQVRHNEQEIVRMHKDLLATYDSTVEGWGLALELRDKDTEGHTRRVCKMTLELAEHFPFSEADRQHIKLGALLHDIGKMGVPDFILTKKGALTVEEKKIMMKHPEFARDMLASITFLQPALDIPFCHHERWDGTGYPQGLKGEKIPLAARIFAVADVWDALISKRHYHEAWSIDRVCEHIVAGSGTHFDPRVVTKFLKLDLCAEENYDGFISTLGKTLHEQQHQTK